MTWALSFLRHPGLVCATGLGLASIGREPSEANPHHALADIHELPGADDAVIVDAELVNQDDHAGPFTPGDDEDRSPFESAPAFCSPEGQPWSDDLGPFGLSGPPADQGMMTLEDAVAAQAEMRRRARLRPAQRTLPPGRSRENGVRETIGTQRISNPRC